MNETRSHRLPDGRRLAFAEYGDPRGRPVLFCHAAPGSRLSITRPMDEEAGALGLRLVAPDRPGYGLSDPHPGRTLGDWPRDVAGMLDALGIRRFSVLGYSLGGAYALACAAALGDRVDSVALCGTLAPGGQPVPVVALARDNPEDLRAMFAPMAGQPDTLLEALFVSACAADQAARAANGIEAGLRRDCAEALRQGLGALIEDFTLVAGDWGFRPEDILQPVRLWHGLDDANVPPAASEWLAARLPAGDLLMIPGQGHLCLQACCRAILSPLRD